MKIYNITFVIAKDTEQEGLQWIKEKHVQQVMETGCFSSARLSKVNTDIQPDAVNYSLQFFSESKDGVTQYINEHAPKIKHDIIKKFQQKILFFETELDYLGDFYFEER